DRFGTGEPFGADADGVGAMLLPGHPMRNCGRLIRPSRKNRVDRRIHGWIVRRTACLEYAVEPNRIAKSRSSAVRHNPKTHSLNNPNGQKPAMLPSAEPEGLGGEEHVLADRRGLAEDVIAGLSLEDRQRQDPRRIEEAALEPMLGAGGTKALAVVDDIEATVCR